MGKAFQRRWAHCFGVVFYAVIFFIVVDMPLVGRFADADQEKRTGRSRTRPGAQGRPQYLYSGAVVTRVMYDGNNDGNPDRWEYYDQGRCVNVEEDRDFDGEVDWREQHREKSNHLDIVEIDGEYKIIAIMLDSDPPYHSHDLVHVEKLVRGRWTGTFEDTVTSDWGSGPCDGPMMVTEHRKYENGFIVSYEKTGHVGNYLKIEYHVKDGVTRHIGRRKEDISRIEVYRKGQRVSVEEDTDCDGRMDRRVEYDQRVQGREKTSILVDGKWIGTYAKDVLSYPWGKHHCQRREWREEGYLQRVECREEGTDILKMRLTYAEGILALLEEDWNWDGIIDFRSRYEPPDMFLPVESVALNEGIWKKDFVVEDDSRRLTYKDGRLVRMEQGKVDDKSGEYSDIINFVGEYERQHGYYGKIEQWLYYSDRMRLLREKRDINGDGEADILIDYDNLTTHKIPPEEHRK